MKIKSFEDYKRAIKHPYRSGEYLTDGTNIISCPKDDSEEDVLYLLEIYDDLEYHVLWEGFLPVDDNAFNEDQIQIEGVYN